jgi:hypothetical protein
MLTTEPFFTTLPVIQILCQSTALYSKWGDLYKPPEIGRELHNMG